VLVEYRESDPDSGLPLPPLLPVERLAAHNSEVVGKANCWNHARCRHLQVPELFSLEECDQEWVDNLPATDVGKFPPSEFALCRRREYRLRYEWRWQSQA
jgi:hypothetical protein